MYFNSTTPSVPKSKLRFWQSWILSIFINWTWIFIVHSQVIWDRIVFSIISNLITWYFTTLIFYQYFSPHHGEIGRFYAAAAGRTRRTCRCKSTHKRNGRLARQGHATDPRGKSCLRSSRRRPGWLLFQIQKIFFIFFIFPFSHSFRALVWRARIPRACSTLALPRTGLFSTCRPCELPNSSSLLEIMPWFLGLSLSCKNQFRHLHKRLPLFSLDTQTRYLPLFLSLRLSVYLWLFLWPPCLQGPPCLTSRYVMTSDSTQGATTAFFQANGYFGLQKQNVFFFPQDSVPAMDTKGKVVLCVLQSLRKFFKSVSTLLDLAICHACSALAACCLVVCFSIWLPLTGW